MGLFKTYFQPTPIKWRKIGDSILIIGTVISTTALVEYENLKDVFSTVEFKHLILASMIFTAVGKVMTNFVAESDKKEGDNADSGN